jgi:hypothetical protein
MKHPLRWLQVIALVAFFFVNPLIVGSVYVALLIIRSASKCISDLPSRFICMSIVCLSLAFIAPFFFVVFPGFAVCALFAFVLIWSFAWHNKTPTKKPVQQEDPNIIDVEVISETIYEEPNNH